MILHYIITLLLLVLVVVLLVVVVILAIVVIDIICRDNNSLLKLNKLNQKEVIQYFNKHEYHLSFGKLN